MSAPKYESKGMPFRRLGNSGLRVPVLSLGGWLTIGNSVKGDPVKELVKTAFENGINMIDTAEEYANGECERHLGIALKELGYRRSDLIITTKLFWGSGNGPNYTGLSRKHIIEGMQESLARLQLDYVDVVFAHRPDPTVPMEETVRAFNYVIEKGWAFYWGTSEWSAHEIEEAFHVADKLRLIPPVAEQCKHHMFHRERPEKEYEPLYRKYDYGTTVFSALAQGLLTGKYNDSVPEDSRFKLEKSSAVAGALKQLSSEEGQAQVKKIRTLTTLAEQELECKMTHLALAWIIVKHSTSTVILGASKPEQILDNLKALEVVPKLTPEILGKIENILESKPSPIHTYGRPELDGHWPHLL